MKTKTINTTKTTQKFRRVTSDGLDAFEACEARHNAESAQKVNGIHYDLPGVETIDVIEDVISRDVLPRKAAYSIGNAVKYLLRCGRKDGEDWQDDVKKAMNYLHRAITGTWMEKK